MLNRSMQKADPRVTVVGKNFDDRGQQHTQAMPGTFMEVFVLLTMQKWLLSKDTVPLERSLAFRCLC